MSEQLFAAEASVPLSATLPAPPLSVFFEGCDPVSVPKGPTGNRTKIDESDGTERLYEYDDLYRLTIETVNDSLGAEVYQKIFKYDDVGNREVQTTTGLGAGTVNYTYDDRDRLLTENGTAYGWDENGNLTSKSGEATYFWDYEDRLIRVEKTDGTVVEHTYDTDGVRVRTETTVPGQGTTVVNYLVDTCCSLSQVVAETDDAGNLASYYVRGDDLLSAIRPAQQRFYHSDGLGSIRVLTDEAGSVTDAYTYAAFGERLSHNGTDPQPFQFAGEPNDPNVGFYYNRARWLDPSLGQFTALDPFRGIPSDPASLHRYLYAASDPVNKIDPSGLRSLASVSISITMVSVLASVAVPMLRQASTVFTGDTNEFTLEFLFAAAGGAVQFGGGFFAYISEKNTSRKLRGLFFVITYGIGKGIGLTGRNVSIVLRHYLLIFSVVPSL